MIISATVGSMGGKLRGVITGSSNVEVVYRRGFLPHLAKMLDEALAHAETQLALFEASKRTPAAIDHATLVLIEKVFGDTFQARTLFATKLTISSTGRLTPAEEAEMRRLDVVRLRIRELSKTIVGLARERRTAFA